MSRKTDAPRPGSKNAYVAKHFALTNAEIIERAKADGVELTRAACGRIRFVLRSQYGFGPPDPKKSHPKSRATDKRGKAKVPKHTPQAKRKYTKKAKAAKHANGVSPARTHKQAQLRKLIFEMGFDDVRSIYLEFQEMHNRFNQE